MADEFFVLKNDTKLNNATTTTDEELKYEPYEFYRHNPVLALTIIIFISLSAAVGTFGNILILVSIATQRYLRTNRDFVFVVNLAIADAFVTMVADPLSVVGKVLGWRFFEQYPGMCRVVGCLCTMSCVASLCTVSAMSCHRYIFVCHTPIYDRIFSIPKTVLMCFSFYVIGFLLIVPNFVGVGGHSFDHKSLECIWDRMANHNFTIVFAVVMVFIPITVTGLAFVKLYVYIHRVGKKALSYGKGRKAPKKKRVCLQCCREKVCGYQPPSDVRWTFADSDSTTTRTTSEVKSKEISFVSSEEQQPVGPLSPTTLESPQEGVSRGTTAGSGLHGIFDSLHNTGAQTVTMSTASLRKPESLQEIHTPNKTEGATSARATESLHAAPVVTKATSTTGSHMTADSLPVTGAPSKTGSAVPTWTPGSLQETRTPNKTSPSKHDLKNELRNENDHKAIELHPKSLSACNTEALMDGKMKGKSITTRLRTMVAKGNQSSGIQLCERKRDESCSVDMGHPNEKLVSGSAIHCEIPTTPASENSCLAPSEVSTRDRSDSVDAESEDKTQESLLVDEKQCLLGTAVRCGEDGAAKEKRKLIQEESENSGPYRVKYLTKSYGDEVTDDGFSTSTRYTAFQSSGGTQHIELQKKTRVGRTTLNTAQALFIIYLVFSICWLPLAILFVADVEDTFSHELHVTIVAWAHLHPSVNWLVYYFTNTKFHAAFRKLLRLDRCC